jgi:uncharacterized membrane protein
MLVAIAILWLVIWLLVLVDIVRRPQFSTTAKVVWALVVLLLPVVGVIVYLIARPPDPTERFGAGSASQPDERLRGEHPV